MPPMPPAAPVAADANAKAATLPPSVPAKVAAPTVRVVPGAAAPLPPRAATGKFQASFTAQDFTKASYFCVDIYYTLD